MGSEKAATTPARASAKAMNTSARLLRHECLKHGSAPRPHGLPVIDLIGTIDDQRRMGIKRTLHHIARLRGPDDLHIDGFALPCI
jgi:hypothetical protein